MLRAPVKKVVRIVVGGYGQVMSTGHSTFSSQPRARLWIVLRPDDSGGEVPLLVEAHNDKSGKVVWQDLGIVSSANVSSKRWMVDLDGGARVTMVLAPCGSCGAGAVGVAGPTDEPHYPEHVRYDGGRFSWLTAVG